MAYEALINFIEENPLNWKSLLKRWPYSLRTIKHFEFDPTLWMLVYNLQESDLTSEVVRQCRGVIVKVEDGKARVVCAPFTKFFNYGEKLAADIDWSTARVQEKIDGMLIKAFRYNGVVYFVTNGGSQFDSSVENSLKAIYTEEKPLNTFFEMLQYALAPEGITVKEENEIVTGTGGWLDKLPEGWTIMMELISPSNCIICSYDKTEMYLVGATDETHSERHTEEVAELLGISLKRPKEFPCHSVEEVQQLMKDWKGSEREGVVVVDGNWNRVKVKCEDYLSRKYLKGEHNFNDAVLFKAVRRDETDDILGSFPSLEKRIEDAKHAYFTMKKGFERIQELSKELKEGKDRKEFSKVVYENYKDLSQYFFMSYKEDPYKCFELRLDEILTRPHYIVNIHKEYEKFNSFLNS